jgi:hypothetical protein
MDGMRRVAFKGEMSFSASLRERDPASVARALVARSGRSSAATIVFGRLAMTRAGRFGDPAENRFWMKVLQEIGSGEETRG